MSVKAQCKAASRKARTKLPPNTAKTWSTLEEREIGYFTGGAATKAGALTIRRCA